jgi:hypothetical protein
MKILSRALALFCIISCFRNGESLAQGGWFSQQSLPIGGLSLSGEKSCIGAESPAIGVEPFCPEGSGLSGSSVITEGSADPMR